MWKGGRPQEFETTKGKKIYSGKEQQNHMGSQNHSPWRGTTLRLLPLLREASYSFPEQIFSSVSVAIFIYVLLLVYLAVTLEMNTSFFEAIRYKFGADCQRAFQVLTGIILIGLRQRSGLGLPLVPPQSPRVPPALPALPCLSPALGVRLPEVPGPALALALVRARALAGQARILDGGVVGLAHGLEVRQEQPAERQQPPGGAARDPRAHGSRAPTAVQGVVAAARS